jgi:16S rRNA (cytosine967-C5)-methyltransferase
VLQQRFTADPKSIKPQTLAARAVPPWLAPEMDLPADYLRQLQREPALWLRARPGAAATLAQKLGSCEPPALGGPLAPLGSQLALDALRYSGHEDLFLTPAFHAGAFEIQDLASQLVGHACSPEPGETWWDACAGEGGKLLHLADLMHNKGVIWATDRNERRLAVLRRRAKRAQLFNYRTEVWDDSARLPTKSKFDGILVDAPCSGVGTWQRNPHARWSTTERDVAELAVTQRGLLDQVAGSLKPGGRLVYSVCTLTRSETTQVADAFGAAHPELIPTPVFGKGATATAAQMVLWPQDLNANGMFIAAWTMTKTE